MDKAMEDWVAKQVKKYAGSNFGESDISVDLNLIAYQTLQSYAKPGQTFLELGCNSGRVCHEMQKKGLFELGVDLPQVIEKVKYPIHKVALNLEYKFPLGKWNIIYAREVIEHLRNHEECIENIFSHLEEKGTAILTYPHDETDGPDNCPEHVKIFSDKEIRDLISKHGGVVVETKKETICRSTILVCVHS